MGKKIISWPQSETDQIVARWAERKGIDMARDVSGYTIVRRPGELPQITLEMFFEEQPAGTEVTGIDSAQPEYVSEAGPEMVDLPAGQIIEMDKGV